MRKNWTDILYWCAQLAHHGGRVADAISKIEDTHGKETIDQQCWKDHAAGTRACDAVTILEWLEDNKENYTRQSFNRLLDRLVTHKLPAWMREVNAQVLKVGTPADVCAAAARRHQRQQMRTTASSTS